MHSKRGIANLAIFVLCGLMLIVMGKILVTEIQQNRKIESYIKGKNVDALEYFEENGFNGVNVEINGTYPEKSRMEQIAAWFDIHLQNDTSMNDNPMARYDIDEETIIVYPGKLEGHYMTLIKLMWHEYGHHVFYHNLSETEQEEYRHIYNAAGTFVTEYSAEEGYKEDFADAYAYYKLGKQLPEDRRRFIESTV